MAIEAAFNAIITGIQLSNLNYTIQLTPYAAYIELKKSTQVDRNGIIAPPSPPLLTLYQELHRNLLASKEEINRLKTAVEESDSECKNLHESNATLLLQLKEANETLSTFKETNANLIQKMNKKDKELENLEAREEKTKIKNKELIQNNDSLEHSIKDLNKNKKTLEKEVHNLSKNLGNCRDSISHLKSEISTQKIREAKFEKDTRHLKKQLKSLEQKNLQLSVSSQTDSCIDVPYSVLEPLPPIFGSKVCIKSKLPFMSRSLPKKLYYIKGSVNIRYHGKTMTYSNDLWL